MDEAFRTLPVVEKMRSTGDPPIFPKVAVVGLGLVGGSIALATRKTWPSGLVIGIDRPRVLEQAVARQAIDVGASDLGIAAEADLVILAAPVEQNRALLDELDGAVVTPAVITDVGSTKRHVVEAARRLPSRFTFVGGHPLAGAARGGLSRARADLFEGRPWIFTPVDPPPVAAVERLAAFARALGASPRTMTAEEHDRVLAYLSHLPQVAVSALMTVVGRVVGTEGLELTGQGLLDTTRLAASPSSVWVDICATNDDELGNALDALIETLTRVRQNLSTRGVVEELFEDANRWRAELEKVALPAPGDE